MGYGLHVRGAVARSLLPSFLLAPLPQAPGAIGDQQRHYYFEEAEAQMLFDLFVPESYDRNTPTPLVVALHGYGGNHDYFFNTDVFARIPVIAAVGGDETGQLEGTQAAVNEINAAGGTAVYLAIPDAGHMPMIRPAVPQILEFFAEHSKAE